MVGVMDDQHEAWKRMTDARLRYLEQAVSPPRVRLARNGRPKPPDPYEPGERLPLTRWLELRLLSMELLFRLVLDAEREQAAELDIVSLEDAIEAPLTEMEGWARAQVEPDLERRETMAMILIARAVLMESHTWPLVELEEME